MLKKVLFPGKYIQGAGALKELPNLIKLFNRQGLILASPTVHKTVLPGSALDLRCPSLLVEKFGGECCEKEITKLSAVIRKLIQ